eukprot:g1424.t1
MKLKKNHNHNKDKKRLKKKNTTSFEKDFTPPDLRVRFGNPRAKTFGSKQTLDERSVVYVPELFCDEEDNYETYHKLIAELKAIEAYNKETERKKKSKKVDDVDADLAEKAEVAKAEKKQSSSLFTLWHGDSHVIANDNMMGGQWKNKCPTFIKVVERMKQYFDMDVRSTRFNWYRDNSDWKPYHFDAAAVKPKYAKTQNVTVAASFGIEREVSFQRAKGRKESGGLTTVNLPLANGSCYLFGKKVNIDWRHGIPAATEKLDENKSAQNQQPGPPSKQSKDKENDQVGNIVENAATFAQNKADHPQREDDIHGRISIIAWGWADQTDDFGKIAPRPTLTTKQSKKNNNHHMKTHRQSNKNNHRSNTHKKKKNRQLVDEKNNRGGSRKKKTEIRGEGSSKKGPPSHRQQRLQEGSLQHEGKSPQAEGFKMQLLQQLAMKQYRNNVFSTS